MILVGGRNDPEGNGNDELEEHGYSAHVDRNPDGLMEFLCNGDRIVPGIPELAPQGVSDPAEEAGDNALVHAVGGGQLGHPLLIGLAPGLLGLLPGQVLDVGRRQAAHQQIDDESHKEENHYGNQNSLEYVFSHVKVPPNTGLFRLIRTCVRMTLTLLRNVIFIPLLPAKRKKKRNAALQKANPAFPCVFLQSDCLMKFPVTPVSCQAAVH